MIRKIAIATVGVFALFLLLETSVLSDYFSTDETQHVSASISTIPDTLTTDTWGIFDPRTGEILAGRNIDVPYPIASVTKLFTALAVLNSDRRNIEVTITDTDVMTEGRSGKLSIGEHTTPYQLLFPLLIESSNDAAEAIRRAFGVAFTLSIEEVLTSQSLTETSLRDASGLSVRNVSTVKDLSVFFTYLEKVYPHVLDITQLNTYISTTTGYVNNNPARSLKNFTGGKHGYTDEAKHTFVGRFKLQGSSIEVGIVLLASDDLLYDINELLQYSENITK